MPLSEHEQRQLEQIEQALYADYPRFASAVRASDPRVHYKRRVVEASFGFVLGIGMLLGGVISKYIWVAVAGFVVMLACAMWALNSYRHMTRHRGGQGTAPPEGPQERQVGQGLHDGAARRAVAPPPGARALAKPQPQRASKPPTAASERRPRRC